MILLSLCPSILLLSSPPLAPSVRQWLQCTLIVFVVGRPPAPLTATYSPWKRFFTATRRHTSSTITDALCISLCFCLLLLCSSHLISFHFISSHFISSHLIISSIPPSLLLFSCESFLFSLFSFFSYTHSSCHPHWALREWWQHHLTARIQLCKHLFVTYLSTCTASTCHQETFLAPLASLVAQDLPSFSPVTLPTHLNVRMKTHFKVDDVQPIWITSRVWFPPTRGIIHYLLSFKRWKLTNAAISQLKIAFSIYLKAERMINHPWNKLNGPDKTSDGCRMLLHWMILLFHPHSNLSSLTTAIDW